MLRPGHLLLAGLLASIPASPGPQAADCRWIVRPYVSETLQDRPIFDIAYDGLERRTFYAFSAASGRIVQRVGAGADLSEALGDVLALEGLSTPLGHTVYRLPPASAFSGTIYLVAAAEPVPALEQAAARFVPARPLTVGGYFPRTRGATDLSGALPRRTDPVMVAEASLIGTGDELTICAYAVPQG